VSQRFNLKIQTAHLEDIYDEVTQGLYFRKDR